MLACYDGVIGPYLVEAKRSPPYSRNSSERADPNVVAWHTFSLRCAAAIASGYRFTFTCH
jgi:hypothetical protein